MWRYTVFLSLPILSLRSVVCNEPYSIQSNIALFNTADNTVIIPKEEDKILKR